WQEDIFVGTPIANRTRAQTEELIGFFVNTLVLRTDLSGNPTFRELLGRVRETTLDAYVHQDMPFDKLVNVVQAERDITHDPLFQVFFSLNNNPAREIRLPRLTLTPVAIDSGVAKFDLEISLVEWDDQLIIKAIYKTALFDSATIKRWLDHYRTLLQGIVANPEEHLLNLPIESTDDTPIQTTGLTFRNTDEFTFDDLPV
ncbi:MAG TPA: condensation domain-containing protein, partial [Pyrinomonadaceae bacterium]